MDRRLLVLLPLLLAVLALPVLADDPPTKEEIQGLIQKLGDPDFEARQRASKQLLEIGEPARKALEDTMKNSDDMEARWRAEQILRRLDRTVEKPVGPKSVAPPSAPPAPPTSTTPPHIRDFLRRMEEGFGRVGPTRSRETLEAEGLQLRIDIWGMIPNLTLVVKPKEGEPRPPRAIYRGRSLDEILRRHPELEKRKGMADLRKQYDVYRKKNRALFPFDDLFDAPLSRSGNIKMAMPGREIEIQQDGERVKVKVTERDATGKPVVKEYEGESLEKLKAKHPELKTMLGDLDGMFRIRHFGPTQLFRDRRLPRPAPVTPSEPGQPTDERKGFGVRVRGVPEVLAVQLGLDEGRGMLVDAVQPKSQAEKIGLKRYDIVMAVNGQPVTDLGIAIGVLKMSAQDASPLTVEVIRGGKRMMLKR